MTTYYAVCNVNGPISVRLDGETEAAAVEEFAAADIRAWIDAPRLDAEDELDICGENMSEDEFDDALKAAGCTPVKDLDPIANAHAGTVAHLADGWYLWAKE